MIERGPWQTDTAGRRLGGLAEGAGGQQDLGYFIQPASISSMPGHQGTAVPTRAARCCRSSIAQGRRCMHCTATPLQRHSRCNAFSSRQLGFAVAVWLSAGRIPMHQKTSGGPSLPLLPWPLPVNRPPPPLPPPLLLCRPEPCRRWWCRSHSESGSGEGEVPSEVGTRGAAIPAERGKATGTPPADPAVATPGAAASCCPASMAPASEAAAAAAAAVWPAAAALLFSLLSTLSSAMRCLPDGDLPSQACRPGELASPGCTTCCCCCCSNRCCGEGRSEARRGEAATIWPACCCHAGWAMDLGPCCCMLAKAP